MSRGLRSKTTLSTEDMEGEGAPDVSDPSINMMKMLKLMMEEQRKSDIAREERKEELRLAREADAKKEQLEQQKALEAKQYAQQVALMEIQAKLGETTSRAHREGQSLDRKRDRALYAIPNWKEGEDLEEYLLLVERRLAAADIEEKEWTLIIEGKLSGKMACAWQDIAVSVEE